MTVYVESKDSLDMSYLMNSTASLQSFCFPLLNNTNKIEKSSEGFALQTTSNLNNLQQPTKEEIVKFMNTNSQYNPSLINFPSYLPLPLLSDLEFELFKTFQLSTLNELIKSCEPINLEHELTNLGISNTKTNTNDEYHEGKIDMIYNTHQIDNDAASQSDDFNSDESEHDGENDTSDNRSEYSGELKHSSKIYSLTQLFKLRKNFTNLGSTFEQNENLTNIALNIDEKEKLSKIYSDLQFSSSNSSKELIIALNEDNFDKVVQIMKQKAYEENELSYLVSLILNKSFNNITNRKQYGLLFKKCLKKFLNSETKIMFKRVLISLCHKAFEDELEEEVHAELVNKEGNNTDNKRQSKIFEVTIMIGELFNQDLISINVLYRGIFQDLLNKPENIKNPRKIPAINIELVCKLLEICGKKLDKKSKYDYDEVTKYISKMKLLVKTQQNKYKFRTIMLVDKLHLLRNNKWKKIIEIEPVYENKRFKTSSTNRFRSFNYNDNNYYYNKKSFNRVKPKFERKINAEFVCDVTIPDRTYQKPGVVLTKKWKMKNSGEEYWGNELKLKFFKGDEEMVVDDAYNVPNAAPNEEIEVSAMVTVPAPPGRYCAYFRLYTDGKFFGPRVWVDIFSLGRKGVKNGEIQNKVVECSA